MVKEIYLSNYKEIILIDNSDYEMLMQYNWCIADGYAITSLEINGIKTTKRMHQFLLDTLSGLEIDHIDNNRLNNQRKNLRMVTHQQNMMNKSKQNGCSSKYKGVCWDNSRNKWISYIKKNNRCKHLGRFNNEKDAANAYNERAKELFGEYANLNEVD